MSPVVEVQPPSSAQNEYFGLRPHAGEFGPCFPEMRSRQLLARAPTLFTYKNSGSLFYKPAPCIMNSHDNLRSPCKTFFHIYQWLTSKTLASQSGGQKVRIAILRQQMLLSVCPCSTWARAIPAIWTTSSGLKHYAPRSQPPSSARRVRPAAFRA